MEIWMNVSTPFYSCFKYVVCFGMNTLVMCIAISLRFGLMHWWRFMLVDWLIVPKDNIESRFTWEVSPYSFKHRFAAFLWPQVMVSFPFILSYGNCNCRNRHFESQGSLSVLWLWGFSSLLGFWRLPLFNNGIETLKHWNNGSMAQHLYKVSNYISVLSYG